MALILARRALKTWIGDFAAIDRGTGFSNLQVGLQLIITLALRR